MGRQKESREAEFIEALRQVDILVEGREEPVCRKDFEKAAQVCMASSQGGELWAQVFLARVHRFGTNDPSLDS